ncbi:MAG TPA: ABC transporter permease [Clostridiales bacterium]|nr:ABC transporter permease [Clostridiales bacterium]
MKISDLMKMGIKNLSRRKARTLLTVIGVVIGTISIVVMISIGIGMNKNFTSQVMEQGSLTTITVTTYADLPSEDGEYGGWKEQKLTDELVEMIKQMENVRAVTPVLQKYIILYSGKYESGVSVTAMDSTLYNEFEFPPLEFGDMTLNEMKDNIIFGSDSIYEFYYWGGGAGKSKDVDISKDKISIGFGDFMTEQGKKVFKQPLNNVSKLMHTDNWEYDYNAFMDIEYFKMLYLKYAKTLKIEDRKKAISSLEKYDQIKINVNSVSNVTKVQEQIKELGYQSSSLAMYLKPMQEASKMLQMVLGSVGAVAMLVSAISIANTMIMSIYERTKEIGIMKVLGCVIKDIKKLFLFEAAMIGFLGGIVGITLSYLASWLINKFGAPLFQALLSGSNMYDMGSTKFSVIPIWLPLLAAGFAMVVGVVSGYYPAKRATKISAIEAMKTEG